jgi:hypothetical protein
MPSKKERPAETKPAEAEESLVPFNVVIDGQDRTIFAKDAEDLKARIARIKAA